mmetsp:Transcript_27519/g.59877  ORF Transcript_27519/g.59877 Transcript_27519/m.59877 type:complete len:240 (+) Transcript_27519:33-752(+)
MKLNIAFPATGAQKMIEIDDEKKLRAVYDKRMGAEIDGEELGEEFKGYIFRISGGNDKQGFPMKQGVLSQKRVRLMLSKGLSCYRPRRRGERKRKSVRGCIVGPDISILNLVIVKKGDGEVAGLSDVMVQNRLGPKRANNIRLMFNLDKDDDVRKYVLGRTFTNKAGKEKTKRPKIQRLITPQRLQRKRDEARMKKKAIEKRLREEQAYQKLAKQRMKEAKERRASEASKRKSRNSKKE